MSATDNERGIALLAVLGIVLSLLPLAAAISMQTQLDGLMGRNFRGSTEAFYAAEAGLAHALSEIGPRAALDNILDGPDTLGATADDGLFPFRSQPLAAFAQGPVGYQVSAERGPADTIRIRSRGRGHHDAIREVEALIHPTTSPFTPAALYVEAADVAVDLGEHGLVVSGLPEREEGTQSAIVGLALSSPAVAVRLLQSLTPAQIGGVGGSPSVAVAASLDLDSYADILRIRLDAVILPTVAGATNETFGTEARPQLTIIDSNCTITAQVEGFGILVVRGDLEIRGSLQYRGLVLAGGGVSSAESSDLQIDGTVWVHAAATQLDLRGTGYIRYNPAALERTDSMIDSALLHLPVVVGWREIS